MTNEPHDICAMCHELAVLDRDDWCLACNVSRSTGCCCRPGCDTDLSDDAVLFSEWFVLRDHLPVAVAGKAQGGDWYE